MYASKAGKVLLSILVVGSFHQAVHAVECTDLFDRVQVSSAQSIKGHVDGEDMSTSKDFSVRLSRDSVIRERFRLNRGQTNKNSQFILISSRDLYLGELEFHLPEKLDFNGLRNGKKYVEKGSVIGGRTSNHIYVEITVELKGRTLTVVEETRPFGKLYPQFGRPSFWAQEPRREVLSLVGRVGEDSMSIQTIKVAVKHPNEKKELDLRLELERSLIIK